MGSLCRTIVFTIIHLYIATKAQYSVNKIFNGFIMMMKACTEKSVHKSKMIIRGISKNSKKGNTQKALESVQSEPLLFFEGGGG